MRGERRVIRPRREAESLDALADVLVIGGGPAGAWAAVSAAQAGARVVLADKGYLGTSGATAPSNTGTWFVPPGQGRRAAIEQRQPRTGGLADPHWVERVLDTAWEKLHSLAAWGYPFPNDDEGRPYLANLRGPDYTHFMRRRVLGAGVCSVATPARSAGTTASPAGPNTTRRFASARPAGSAPAGPALQSRSTPRDGAGVGGRACQRAVGPTRWFPRRTSWSRRG